MVIDGLQGLLFRALAFILSLFIFLIKKVMQYTLGDSNAPSITNELTPEHCPKHLLHNMGFNYTMQRIALVLSLILPFFWALLNLI